MNRIARGAIAVAVLAGTACDAPASRSAAAADSTVLAQRAARLQQKLAAGDSVARDEPIARWDMPADLREISGLTLTADGRLFTHGDERAKVYEVDYRRGAVVKEFDVGDPVVHGDFESIAIVRDTMVLFTSDGLLYRFREGRKGQRVGYVTEDTGLGDKCEFESIAFDSASNTLLMACKHVHVKALRDSLIIYRWPVDAKGDSGRAGASGARKVRKLSYLAVPLSRIIGSNGWTTLHPSDITIDPFTGNYVIVASIEKALIDITPAGVVVFARPLPPGHEQAEGVAITRDSILIISDEAKGSPAQITLYRWHPSP